MWDYVALKTTGATPVWAHIPHDAALAFNGQIEAWDNAYQDAIDTPTPAKHHERDRVHKLTDKAARDFVNQYLRYPPVTNEDRDNMGIPNRSTNRTPRPNPADHVEFTLRIDAQGHIVIADYRIEGAAGRGKGDYHGAEIRIWILPLDAPAPIGPDHPGWVSEVDTATPWKRAFTEADLGKRLYVVMRWKNPSSGKNLSETSGKGPWSVIQSVVIA
jgi:hypothetical protein